jgi:hypothetical protein
VALDDDIRITVTSIRSRFQQEVREREHFNVEWGKKRTSCIVPIFNSVRQVLKELGWECKFDYAANSAKLSLGTPYEDRREFDWRYDLLLAPDTPKKTVLVFFRKAEEIESRESLTVSGVEDLQINQLIVDFIGCVEEVQGQRNLPK